MAEQKGIVFFKEIPSRKWPENPYTKYDDESVKCLSYKQMNRNLSNLEGRDIKSIDVDENCNPVINLVNGETLTVENASCSGKGGVLKEDLDYSQMFVDGGCCYPTRHFGWLGQMSYYGYNDEYYNTNPNDTFEAGTDIEYVLRQILVSKTELVPSVHVTFYCNADYQQQGIYQSGVYSWNGNTASQSPYTVSGNVSVNFSGNNGYQKNCTFNNNGSCSAVTLSSLVVTTTGGAAVDLSSINLTISVIVNIAAEVVPPQTANAYFIYNMDLFLSNHQNPSISDVITEVNTTFDGVYYSKQLGTIPDPNTVPVISKANSDSEETWDLFSSGGGSPYYFNAMIMNDDDNVYSALIIENGFECNPFNVFYHNGAKWTYKESYLNGNTNVNISGYTTYVFNVDGGIQSFEPIVVNIKQI